LVYRDGGRECGQVVFRTEGPGAQLLQATGESALILDALVRAALNAADLAGAREMVCQVPALYPALSAVGFVKSDKGMGIQIREFFNHPCSHP
jgi:hypothetical protein